jgi:hypothetical protein
MSITRKAVKEAIATACLCGLNPLESKWINIQFLLDVLQSDTSEFNSDSQQQIIRTKLAIICPPNTRNNDIKRAIILAIRYGENPFSPKWNVIETLVDMYNHYHLQSDQEIDILLRQLFPEKIKN